MKVLQILLLSQLLLTLPGRAELAETAWRALEAYRENSTKAISVPTIREVFADLSDVERIEAIYAYLRADDTSRAGTALEMPKISISPFLTMIKNDPDLVSDLSHLRKMIEESRDPRGAFFLTSLANAFSISREFNTTKEMRHLLDMTGKVSNVPPEWSSVIYDNASLYFYTVIVAHLTRFDIEHPFELGVRPDSAQIRELRDWLDNYHGVTAPKERLRSLSQLRSNRSSEKAFDSEERTKSEDGAYSGWVLLGIVSGIVLVFFGFYRMKKQ